MGAPFWFILRTSVGKEASVIETAKEAGFEAYSPFQLETVFVRRVRKLVDTIIPMLPGYIFVRMDDPRETHGRMGPFAYGFLRNGDASYAVINDRSIEAVRAEEHSTHEAYAAQKRAERDRKNRGVQVGDTIGIVTGSFYRTGRVVTVRSRFVYIEIGRTKIKVNKQTAVEGLQLAA